MQTSKFLFVMGAMTAAFLPLQVQAAPDSEEQAKMREALRRMIDQSTPPEAAPAPATKSVKTAKPPPAPTVVAPPPTEVMPVVVIPPPPAPAATTTAFESVPPPDDPATIARAREAMRQKILEMQPTQPTLVAPAPVAHTPTVVAPPPTAVVPVVVIPPPPAPAPTTAAFESVPLPDDPAAIARAREAMRQKILELQPTQPTLAAPAPVAPASGVQPAQLAVVAPSSANASVKMPPGAPVGAQEYTPIQGPASPLSGSKQAKLAELLSRYRTDAITAQEYHTQRAAIIAEP